ncbi:MAG: hypothetical protein IK018_06675 [Lachnospiraceae bacterium]|nr:hypothetical protein [Lachnospiraceae bacterium]
MKLSILTDLKAWIYSGRIMMPLAIVAFLFSLSVLGSYRFFVAGNNFFLREEEDAIEQGLYDEYVSAFSKTSDNTLYDNELLVSDLEKTGSNLHALSPKHALSYCMEMGYFFFPFLMTVFGAYTVKADMSSKIMRFRAAREGRWAYFWGKQIVLFVLIIGCVIVGIITDFCISLVTFAGINKKQVFSLIDISGNKYPNLGNNLGQVAFFVFFILLFLELGFSLAFISKSLLIPTVIAIFVFYVMPMYKYSPLNALTNVFAPLCDFQGIVHFKCIPIDSLSAFSIILLLLIIPLFSAVLFNKFRSMYKF